MKKWKILNKSIASSQESVIEVLLENRGVKDREAFFDPPKPERLIARLSGYLPDLDLEQLDRAIARLQSAIASGEKIAIWGDYDVDGVTATAILWQALAELGVKATPYIPNRFTEGYGVGDEGVKRLKEKGISLLVTVDSGITAIEEVELANSLGIDVIVTDHHLKPKKLPSALATVHTINLCGAGIAWLLSSKLVTSHSPASPAGGPLVTSLLDLVAIATVADLQPLTGANRILASHGFEVLNRNDRPGLAALVESAGLKPGDLGSYAAGWVLGPRINAVGRIGGKADSGEGAIEALRLLCASSVAKARELAQLLESANKKRQVLTAEIFDQARSLVGSSMSCPSDQLIVVYDDDWHEGVIGLVAGKLAEECGRPAVVIAKGDESCPSGRRVSKGSARSVNGFNILEALRSHADLLEDVGGHAGAAGFTVANNKLERFVEALRRETTVELEKLDPRPVLKIDMELPLRDLTRDLVMELAKFEPCGLGNPEPIFVANEVNVLGERQVGRRKQHLKLSVSPGFEAIWFNHGEDSGFTLGEEISFAYTPQLDRWNGKEKVTLRIRDLHK
jgi:single-stranded-DNA-specific exonuclease